MRTPILFLVLSITLISSISHGQLVVKDQESTPNTLLEVNDEGIAGSLTLPNVGNNLIGTKLYNNGGKLFWGESQLDLLEVVVG